MDAPSFSAGGVELALSPDPAGVVLKVQLAGALAGLSRKIVLPVELADNLCDELARAIVRSRDMKASVTEAGR